MNCELFLIACIFLRGVLIPMCRMICVKQYHTVHCNTVKLHTTSNVYSILVQVIVNLALVHFSLQVQGKILLQKVSEFILFAI